VSDLDHFINRLEAIDSRLYETSIRLEEKLDSQNQILLRNTITLEDHVRRTNLLEERVESIEKDVISYVKKDEWIHSSVSKIAAGIAALITLVCTVLTAWYTLKK
jgi:hypothetical protein